MPAAQAYAPPGFWGPWIDLQGWFGNSHSVRYSFDTESQAPSTFSVEIRYVDEPVLKTIQTIGPGNYLVRSNGGIGVDRIRCKSHSIGQNIRITW
ncbi:colicin Z C-terminal domain-related protein [Photorhabdus heterorhabditis]|uniref:colicin Z C-terminal domain-related protein n=1 Tax=Photorhabdus heterorhabditis TaxID=880156 RepID=UPI00265F391C|nr:colicin Z C-terminal domain-related protein [Photorhabdus heterorhabditis]